MVSFRDFIGGGLPNGEGDLVRRPSPKALLWGLIPFVGTCFSVALWDRIEPRVLGLPFSFFWLISWLFLTPLCMWRAYRIEARHDAAAATRKEDGDV